jgi:hypothetical protein
MDPMDLKTLAQFCLYGDPSVTPVATETSTEVPKGTDRQQSDRLGRQERRAKLAISGRQLQEQKPTAGRRDPRARVSPALRRVLHGLARDAGVETDDGFVAFRVDAKQRGRAGKGAAGADRYHVLVARPAGAAKKKPPVNRVAVVARQVGSRIVGYRVYYSH